MCPLDCDKTILAKEIVIERNSFLVELLPDFVGVTAPHKANVNNFLELSEGILHIGGNFLRERRGTFRGLVSVPSMSKRQMALFIAMI